MLPAFAAICHLRREPVLVVRGACADCVPRSERPRTAETGRAATVAEKITKTAGYCLAYLEPVRVFDLAPRDPGWHVALGAISRFIIQSDSECRHLKTGWRVACRQPDLELRLREVS